MEQLKQLVETCISMFTLVILISPFIILYFFLKPKNKVDKNDSPVENIEEVQYQEQSKEILSVNSNPDFPYQKRLLLTKNEWNFYRQLKPITDKLNLHILSKVRMADLVDVQRGLSRKKYYSAFAKIKSKHVDFVLTNPGNLAIKLIIELDDSTHDTKDGKERDYFVNKTFEIIGIPIIHVRNIQNIENLICEKLNIQKALGQ